MKKNHIYLVKWEDTFTPSRGWKDEEDIEKMAKEAQGWIQTIGKFVGKYHGYIVLSSSHNNKDVIFYPYNNLEFIPSGCMKSFKELK